MKKTPISRQKSFRMGTTFKSPNQLGLFDSPLLEPQDPRLDEVGTALRAILDNWDFLFRDDIADDTPQERCFEVLAFCWHYLKPIMGIIPPYDDNSDIEGGSPITPASLRLAAMKSQFWAKHMIKMCTVVPLEEWTVVLHAKGRGEASQQ